MMDITDCPKRQGNNLPAPPLLALAEHLKSRHKKVLYNLFCEAVRLYGQDFEQLAFSYHRRSEKLKGGAE